MVYFLSTLQQRCITLLVLEHSLRLKTDGRIQPGLGAARRIEADPVAVVAPLAAHQVDGRG